MSEIERLAAEVRRLADREAIRDTLHAYAAGMDTRDWALLRSVFDPEIVIDTTQELWDGNRADRRWHGVDAVMKNFEGVVGKHFVSHHMITNHRITIDGDTARAVGYLHSVHLDDPQKPDAHQDHGAWYLFALRRTNDGWKIAGLKHNTVWTEPEFGARGPITDADVSEMREHLRKS